MFPDRQLTPKEIATTLIISGLLVLSACSTNPKPEVPSIPEPVGGVTLPQPASENPEQFTISNETIQTEEDPDIHFVIENLALTLLEIDNDKLSKLKGQLKTDETEYYVLIKRDTELSISFGFTQGDEEKRDSARIEIGVGKNLDPEKTSITTLAALLTAQKIKSGLKENANNFDPVLARKQVTETEQAIARGQVANPIHLKIAY